MSSLPAVKQQTAIAPVEQEIERAKQIVASGLLPASIKTPQQALIIMWKGREIGLKEMQSFAHLYVVNGQVAMDTKLMYALYESRGHTASLLESTAEKCTIKFHLRDGREFTYTLTMAEAQAAHWHQNWDKEKNTWVDKPTWKSMPRIMLRYATMRTGIRAYAPSCLFGMLTIDEAESDNALADALDTQEIIEGSTREVPQEELPQASPQEAPQAPDAPQEDYGNEPQEVNDPNRDDELPPVAFQRAFFAWLEQAAQVQNIKLTGKPLYEALKATGKMKPHLRNYDKIALAQADALVALAEIKRQEAGAGK